MDTMLGIAKKNKLWVIEDAAQGIGSKYKGRSLGSLGHIGALSFHETKNIHSGEGGALFVNDERLLERADIISEKGTNRKKFMAGLVDKYTWVDIGSSYLPSDLIAAFLWAQLEKFDSIMALRMNLWNKYHEGFQEAETKGLFRRPALTASGHHNAHMYYLVLPSKEKRDALIKSLAQRGIHAVFHYVPLHSSPAGIQYGYSQGNMDVTTRMGDTLLRLPFWIGLEEKQKFVVDSVIEEAAKFVRL
jgi:dTDP-4-amino-4,6-dideoxygalactose transaminase